MASISGTVTLDGSGVSGAKVYVINDTDGTLEGSTTTDSNGDYSISVTGGITVHVAVQYEDGNGNQYNDHSKPFVASGATIVDSFEDQGLSEYTSDTGSYSTTSSFASDGSYGVSCDAAATANIYSSSGLDNYPSKPVEFKVDMQTSLGTSDTTDTIELSPIFGFVDSNNWYMLQIRADGPNMRFWIFNSGSFSTVTSATSLSEWQANTTYTLQIQWDDGSTFGGSDGDMSAEVFDPDGNSIGTNSGNDTTHNGSGIGFRSNKPSTSDDLFYDFYRITGP